MTPTRIRASVVSERAAWVRSMLQSIQDLPMDSYAQFASDPRNVAAAESFLRRSIEALLDLGRHILAKGFGYAVTEYIEEILAIVINWIRDHPGKMDHEI